MLVDRKCCIPGVDSNQELEKWFNSKGIKTHPELSISQSTLGGIGLFFSKDSISYTEKIELARIPKNCSLSLETTLSLLDMIKKYEEMFQDEDIILSISQVIKEFLILNCPGSELDILKTYCLAFDFLKNLQNTLKDKKIDGKFKEYFNGGPLADTFDYLNILLHTKVNTMDNDSTEVLERGLEIYENYKTIEINIAKILQENELEYTSLIQGVSSKFQQQFKTLFPEIVELDDLSFFEKLLPLSEYHQLNSAVKSRVLEIPAAIHPDKDDFIVNITLVPLLDFANHSNSINSKNAYFDIDRSTNEILLIFEPNIIPSLQKLGVNDTTSTTIKQKIEIFISYSPVEEISNFFTTYGFIPQDSTQEKLFEISVEEKCLVHAPFHCELPENSDKILKWLHILPNIQFIFSDIKKPKLNYDNCLFPLIFANLKYDAEWYNKLDKDMDLEQIRGLKEYEDNIGSYIIDLPQVAVTLTHKLKQVSPADGSEVLDIIDLEGIEECFIKATRFIRNYCKWRVCQLKKYIHDLKEEDEIAFSNSKLLNIVEFEVELLSNFADESNYHDDEIYDLEHCKQEWVDHRYKPVINFSNISEDE